MTTTVVSGITKTASTVWQHVKTLIDQMRQEVAANGGSSLLLSGDINTGVPESDLQDAEPDFLGMSDIGYDAMAVGNHEFDNPLSVLESNVPGQISQCLLPTFMIKTEIATSNLTKSLKSATSV